jgi:hypothetical protein
MDNTHAGGGNQNADTKTYRAEQKVVLSSADLTNIGSCPLPNEVPEAGAND